MGAACVLGLGYWLAESRLGQMESARRLQS